MSVLLLVVMPNEKHTGVKILSTWQMSVFILTTKLPGSSVATKKCKFVNGLNISISLNK